MNVLWWSVVSVQDVSYFIDKPANSDDRLHNVLKRLMFSDSWAASITHFSYQGPKVFDVDSDNSALSPTTIILSTGEKRVQIFFKTLYSPLPCHFCNQFLSVNGPHFFMKSHIFSKCQRETILFCNSAKTRVCLNQHAKVLGLGNDPIRRYACHMYLYTQPCSVGQMPGSGHFCVFSFTPSLEVPEILQAVFYTMEVKVNK